jgi:hypothetical protein
MPMVLGAYEAQENVLRLWHPERVVLGDPETIKRFFKEVARLIMACPAPPYVLVDYTNAEIPSDMTQEYAAAVRAYRPGVKGVFRYNISGGTEGVLTRVTVLIANKADANIFPDEASARAAVRKARAEQS